VVAGGLTGLSFLGAGLLHWLGLSVGFLLRLGLSAGFLRRLGFFGAGGAGNARLLVTRRGRRGGRRMGRGTAVGNVGALRVAGDGDHIGRGVSLARSVGGAPHGFCGSDGDASDYHQVNNERLKPDPTVVVPLTVSVMVTTFVVYYQSYPTTKVYTVTVSVPQVTVEVLVIRMVVVYSVAVGCP